MLLLFSNVRVSFLPILLDVLKKNTGKGEPPPATQLRAHIQSWFSIPIHLPLPKSLNALPFSLLCQPVVGWFLCVCVCGCAQILPKMHANTHGYTLRVVKFEK